MVRTTHKYRYGRTTGMGIYEHTIGTETGIRMGVQQKLYCDSTVYDQLSNIGPFSKEGDKVNATTSEQASGGEPSSLSGVEQRWDCSTII